MYSRDDIFTSKEAQFNFLKCLMRISRADGVVVENEKQYFMQAAQALQLPSDEIEELNKEWDADNITPSFTTKKEALYALMQMVQLGWIDGDYSVDEKDEVKKIALDVGLSPEDVSEVESWAEEAILWNKKGDSFLERA